jgi:multidrug resistance efflux pump
LDRLDADYRCLLRAKALQLEKKQGLLDSMDAELRYWRKQAEALSREQEKRRNEPGNERTSGTIALDQAFMELEKRQALRDIAEKEKALLEEEGEQQEQDHFNRKLRIEKEIQTLSVEKETTLQTLQRAAGGGEASPSLNDALPEDDRYDPERTPFVTVVRSRHEGILSELTVADVGEYVRKHDPLCTILPKDASLYMDITVPNKDVGFIATGMPVKYKFDAFPYTDCGFLFGKVDAISPAATEDRALGLVYHVHGTLEAPCFEIRGNKYLLRPGMTATAELVTDTKSILSILFSRLKG